MKNLLTIIFFIAGLVLFVQMIQAKTVDEIISKYNLERGGEEGWLNIKSIYMEGVREMMGNMENIKIIKVQERLYRVDFEFFGKSGYTIISPHKGWSYIPFHSDTVNAIPSEKLRVLNEEMDIGGPLLDYLVKGNKVKLEGKENINGSDAYKIVVTLKSESRIIYMIDVKSSRLVQTRRVNIHDDHYTGFAEPIEIITNYSNYKFVNGLLFPFLITSPGKEDGKTIISKIELNINVPEHLNEPG